MKLVGFELRALPWITALVGGSPNALDGIPTVSPAFGTLETGATILLTFGRSGQMWQLIAGDDATNPAEGVVRPLDFDGTTNARIWV